MIHYLKFHQPVQASALLLRTIPNAPVPSTHSKFQHLKGTVMPLAVARPGFLPWIARQTIGANPLSAPQRDAGLGQKLRPMSIGKW
jgi:hypothetical protein